MNVNRITKFLYEIGSLKKIARAHRQSLLTDDLSDNIASHCHRVSTIAYFIAKKEGADIGKVLTMAIFHDVGESRSGDQNWVHKRYVKVFDKEILNDQFKDVVDDDELFSTMKEYEVRESLESKIVKDADRLDQYFLIQEYIMRGNKEAVKWLKDKVDRDLFTDSAKQLFNELKEVDPADWWKKLWVEKRR